VTLPRAKYVALVGCSAKPPSVLPGALDRAVLLGYVEAGQFRGARPLRRGARPGVAHLIGETIKRVHGIPPRVLRTSDSARVQ